MDRHWTRQIQPRLSGSIKVYDQITATWRFSSSRRRCSKMWRSGRIVQVKVCGYFALVNSSLDSLLGKRRRTKEKVSVLFEPSFFWTFPVFPSNSRTFRRYSRWSFIARQCTVTGWLRRVHLPHRERSRHAFHHPVWMIPGGKSLKRDRQSVFCTAVNPMYTHQHQEEVQYDLDKPRIVVYKNKWRIHQNTEKVVQFETRQRKGLQFYRRRSNAITLFNFVPAICFEKVAHMKIGEDFSAKCTNLQGYPEPHSRRICIMDVRIFLIPKREHLPTIKANEARGNSSR